MEGIIVLTPVLLMPDCPPSVCCYSSNFKTGIIFPFLNNASGDDPAATHRENDAQYWYILILFVSFGSSFRFVCLTMGEIVRCCSPHRRLWGGGYGQRPTVRMWSRRMGKEGVAFEKTNAEISVWRTGEIERRPPE